MSVSLSCRSGLLSALVAISLSAGCGGGTPGPSLIEGGGVADPGVGGTIHVHVINNETNQPVAGAEVFIGDGTPALQGVTDAAGLASFEDPGLDGPQTVTVVAQGFTLATWFGVDGVNVTVPMAPDASSTPPQAVLSGTISGWNNVPLPPTDHTIFAVVDYTDSRSITDPANGLDPPGGALASTCFVSDVLGHSCDFALNSRVGNVAVFAPIFLVNNNTLEAELIGFAIQRGIEVVDGVAQDNLALEMLEPYNPANVSVTMPATPAGLDSGAGIFTLDLGEEGLATVISPQMPELASPVALPPLEGPLSGASYRLTVIAQQGDLAPQPAIGQVTRDITNLGDTVAFSDWLGLPEDLGLIGTDYSFLPTAAPLHGVSMREALSSVWEVVILDGRSQFALPDVGVQIDPNSMVVSAVDGPFDPRSFGLQNVFSEVMTRLSEERIVF